MFYGHPLANGCTVCICVFIWYWYECECVGLQIKETAEDGERWRKLRIWGRNKSHGCMQKWFEMSKTAFSTLSNHTPISISLNFCSQPPFSPLPPFLLSLSPHKRPSASFFYSFWKTPCFFYYYYILLLIFPLQRHTFPKPDALLFRFFSLPSTFHLHRCKEQSEKYFLWQKNPWNAGMQLGTSLEFETFIRSEKI